MHMQVLVRYFAAHRDITGHAEETLVLGDGATVGMVWELLVTRYPRLAGYSGRMLLAVNQEFATLETELQAGDELAFIPPVSGGSGVPRFCISATSLDPAPLVQAVQDPAMGSIVTFAGVARNHFAGRATARLEYQAYESMAVAVLEQIAQEAQQRWNTGLIAIHHRIGVLEIGETAVLVVVASPHRREGFAAAEWIMDRIKEVAPIWKKEIWADGMTEWVGDEKERKGLRSD